MAKVLVYIDGMKLKKIDAYCENKKISRSKLFVRGALALAHEQPLPRCETEMCKNPSMGRYQIIVNDWEQGELKKTMNLCEYHRKKASSEGEVIEL